MASKELLVKNEYERLKSLYKNADAIKLELVDTLLEKAAFLKIELDDLEKQTKVYGSVQYSNKGNTRMTIAYKTYLQSLNVYQSVIKSIDKIMGNNLEEDDDEFEEFIKQAGGK